MLITAAFNEKVTTILREINKNICHNVEVNICCINQYSDKK